jgi:ribosome-binding ATPase YchF (GTP1/OBG family)
MTTCSHVMAPSTRSRPRGGIEFELALADPRDRREAPRPRERSREDRRQGALSRAARCIEKGHEYVKEGRAAVEAKLSARARQAAPNPLSQLLTTKPILYAANVTDAELSGEGRPHVRRRCASASPASGERAEVVPSPPKIESELVRVHGPRPRRACSRRSGSSRRGSTG